MKLIVHILVVVAYLSHLAYSQASFIKTTDEVQENKNADKTFFVDVVITSIPTGKSSASIDFQIDPISTASSADYEILSQSRLNFNDNSKTHAAILIRIKKDEVVEPNETIVLNLIRVTGDIDIDAKSSSITVVIKDADINTPLIPPFALYVGTNFDYLDKSLTLKSLNFGANAFIPEVIGRVGINFGFNQNRSFSFNVDSSGRLNSNIPVTLNYIKYNSTQPPGKDSIRVVRQFRQLQGNSQVDNTSAYLGLTYSLKKLSTPNLRLYLQGRGEILSRTITTDIQSKVFSQDTIQIPIRNFRPSRIENTGYKQSSIDGYFGAGAYLVYKNDDFWVRGQVLFGYAGHSFQYIQNNGNSKVFYYAEGSVTESKLLGLTFGVEVRGFMPNYAPSVTVTLSKIFTLSKLTEFLQAPSAKD